MCSLLLSAIAVTGCSTDSAEQQTGVEAELLKVDVVSPLVTDVNVEGEYVGMLEYENQVSVVPLLSGEVTATYFEEGDYVEEGDLLFTLDDEAYQLQLENAQITYQQAQSGVDSQLGQLQMGRDSAANSVSTAQEGISQIQDSYDYFNEQIADLDASKADLAEDRADLKEDLLEVRDQISDLEDSIPGMQNAYNDAYAAYEAARIQREIENTSGIPTTVSDADFIMMREGVDRLSNALSAARSTLSSLKSAEEQIDKAIAQYDSSMDQIDSSKEGLIYQRDNLDYSMEQALRGQELAQEQLDYYDNYTIPSAQSSAATTLQQAQLGINSANLQLEYTRVTAPVSGTIMMKNVEELGMAQAGYAAYVIVSDDSAVASFSVPESTYHMLSLGQSVTVERNGVTYEGSIVELPLQVNQQTGMFTIKAALKGNTDNLVMGTSVKITLTMQHADNVLTIPIDCVYYESGKAFTYVLEGNVVRKVFIETGLYDDVNMQILDGITEDMRVITTWSSTLRDGLTVQVSEESLVSDTINTEAE